MSKLTSLICLFYFLTITSCSFSQSAQLVPAMFIFGDSIVDSGNNNWVIGSTAFNDWLPYGMDFLAGPTGRFSNNKTLADALGQRLGLPHYAPIFNDPTTTGGAILAGVNYASAGSGVLDETNASDGVIPLSHQIKGFVEVTYPELEEQLGDETLAFMANSIFMFNTGANDIANECFMSAPCILAQVIPLIVNNYTEQLKRLHNMGARKFVLFGLQPIGCSPYGRRLNGSGGCESLFNIASVFFNAYLRSKIDSITKSIPGSYVAFFDASNAMMEIISDPLAFGFKVINASCCATFGTSSSKVCVADRPACSDRTTYLYFDAVHPTDVTNMILSEWALNTTRVDLVYPYNVGHLARIQVNTRSKPSISKRDGAYVQ